jgi:hypothetical protein
MFRGLLVTLVLWTSIAVFAQTNAPSIEGAWQISSVVITGAGAINNPKAQPSQIVFTKTHYTWVSLGGTVARKPATRKDQAKPTDVEKMADWEMWNPLTAQGGTYQFNGTTLTRRPTVAKNVAVMTTNPPIVQQARVEGNKLTLVQKSAAGQPANETTTVLTRVD